NHCETEEYRQHVAEVQFQVVFREQKDLPLYTLWVFRDFGIDKYKGRNTKGLLTYAGLRKDAYALYKAFLRPDVPVVHLTSKTCFLRRGRPDNGIKAYSNRPELTLTLNGEDRGRRLSKPPCRTDLSFKLREGAGPAKIYVLFTEGTPIEATLSGAGFRDANLAGRWRDNDLRLVGFRAWMKEARAGDTISVPGATADYVVLV